jgi:hypothetical protein
MFDVIVDNRNVSIRGNVENFLGNNQAGIVIYRNNTSGAFTVYLSGKDWYRHTTQVTSADSGTTVSTSLSWSSDTAWTTPAGTTLWLDTTVHIPNNSQTTDFYMSSAGTPVYGITQLITGNVGVGNSNPTYMLDVNGKQRLTGNVISQNAGPRLQINDFDGTEDTSMYAIAQITQNSTGVSTWSNQACLAFVRSGNWVTGLGFARGSNVFGIGQGQGSTTAFTPSFLSVTQGGNVGIGTTSPAFTLDVNGPVNTSRSLRLGTSLVGEVTRFAEYNNNGSDRWFRLSTLTSNANDQFFNLYNIDGSRVDDMTHYGYVSFSPRAASYQARFNFSRISVGATTHINVYANSSNQYEVWARVNSFTYLKGDVNFKGVFLDTQPTTNNTWASSVSAGLTFLHSTASNAPFIEVNPNTSFVGIGNSNPSFRLDVAGNTRLNNAVIGDVGFGNTWAAFAHSNEFNTTDFGLLHSSVGETILNCATGQVLRFRRNNADLGVWNATGLGIGTSSAANTLDVLGTCRVKSTTALKGSGNQLNMFSVETNDASPLAFNVRNIPSATATAQGIHIHAVEPGVSDDRNLILQASGGRIGIGTSSPSSSYKCHVGGSLLADGDVVGFSDIRLKSNIKIIDNALVKLHSINGYTFNIKADNRKHTGLIAQEVKDVLPEAVHDSKNDDGSDGYLSLAYGNMAGLFVEAIKEVDNKYKTHISTLQQQVSSLQQELSELKQMVQSALS